MRSALDRVTGGGADFLFVFSSLSSCGRFTAGPQDVLSGIREFCQTVGYPTHTYCYPKSAGEAGPLYDAASTPSQNGFLTEVFRNQAGVIRSIHATHSMAVAGPLAQQLCSGHYRIDTPCGAGTPYARLLERRTKVLMFGVSFHSYTFFHTAEDASGSEFAYERGTIDRLSVIDEWGNPQETQGKRQSWTPRRFREAGDLLERAGLVRRVTLGRGSLLYVPDSLKVHDFLVERLKKIPDFLYESCTSSLQ
jgi:aminoglycoside 3-N-acetyltransferase